MSVVLAALVFVGPLFPITGVWVRQFAHAPLSVFPALVWSSNPWVWLASVFGVLAFGPLAERTLGSARTVILGLTGHVVSTAAVVVTAWTISDFSHAWAHLLEHECFGGPWMWLIAVLMVASRRWPGMWRGRMLSLLVPVSLTAAAFAGTPFEVGLVAALGWGWVMSLAGLGGPRRAPGERAIAKLAGARSEQRFVIAAVVAGVVCGILVALGAPHLVGPLAGTRFLLAHPQFDPADLTAICADPTRARVCAYDTFMTASSGPGAIALASIPLILQLILADGLRKGRRAAWTGTVFLQILLALLAVAHFVSATSAVLDSDVLLPSDGLYLGRLLLPVLVPGCLALLVATHQRLFKVETEPNRLRAFYRIVPTTAVVAVALFAGVALLFPGQFEGQPVTVSRTVAEGCALLLPSAALSILSPALFPVGPIALAATQLIPLVPWVVTLVLTWRLMHAPVPTDATQCFRTAVVDHATSTSTLAWMGTWEGCSVWRSQRVPGAIAYQEHRGVALTVGDPVCADEHLPELLHEFREYCESTSLVPGLYSVHQPSASVAAKWGWTLVTVAEETVIPLGDVAFKGKKFQDLHTAQNRAAKEGIEARWTTWSECSIGMQQQIRAISEEWLGGKETARNGLHIGRCGSDDGPARAAAARGRCRRPGARSDVLGADLRPRAGCGPHPRLHAPRRRRLPSRHGVPLGPRDPRIPGCGDAAPLAFRGTARARCRRRPHSRCVRPHSQHPRGTVGTALRIPLPALFQIEVRARIPPAVPMRS